MTTFDPHDDAPALKWLIPPVVDYRYFEDGESLFDPAAHDYSPINAWWLAEASLLVYGDFGFVQDRLAKSRLVERAGFQWEPIASGDDVAGVLIYNERAAIAAFRGTRLPAVLDSVKLFSSLRGCLHDVVTDAQVLPMPFDHGCVHAGFARAFEPMANEVVGRLNALAREGRTVWFAGHSLGGAIATLAAARFGHGRFRGLYTYGSPRVGDGAFAAAFEREPCFRVVHHDDLVARIPPPVRYKHLGRFVYLDRDGSLTIDADASRATDIFAGRVNWTAMLRDTTDRVRDVIEMLAGGLPSRLAELPVPRGAIRDHAPIYYAALLKEQLARQACERPPSGAAP